MAMNTPRFTVRAASRHPVLGRDYDPVRHAYEQSYVRQDTYRIVVDAFPGKTVLIPKEDQQLPPGGDPKQLKDIEKLKVPLSTVGFDFSIKGIARKKLGIGKPIATKFTASASRELPSVTGSFDERQPDNPWDWQVEVPGPGTYEITVVLKLRTGRGPSDTKSISIRDSLVVSIGDSAASGQGNPDIAGRPEGFKPDLEWYDFFVPAVALYKISKAALDRMANFLQQKFTTLARAAKAGIDMDPRPVWLEANAYRSLRSGPALAARLMEDTAKGRLVTFLAFGRTGSEIRDGLLGPRTSDGRKIDKWIGNIGQVEEVRQTLGNRRIDALLIYIGVNDIGVAGTLEQMITGDNPVLGDGGNDTESRREIRRRGMENLSKIPDKLDELAVALRGLNVRHVYLTEYPTALFDGANGEPVKGCGVFDSTFDADVTAADARLIKELAENLNALLRSEAERLGWFYISGIAEGFESHGYCTGDRRFFVQAEESMITQGDTEGMVHPNAAGVRVVARHIAAMVKERTLAKEDSETHLGGDQEAEKVVKPSARPKRVKAPKRQLQPKAAGAK